MESRRNLPSQHLIVASSFGGMITSLIMTPLDVVKIRMQSHRLLYENKCFIYCNGLVERLCTCPADMYDPWFKKPGGLLGSWMKFAFARPPDLPTDCIFHTGHYSSGFALPARPRMPDVLWNIIRNEGIASLWSGLSPTLVMALPQTVIYFTVNDWLKERVGYSSIQINGQNAATWTRISRSDWVPPIIGGTSRIIAVAAISPLELLRTKMQSIRMTPRRLSQTIWAAVKQGGPQSLWTGMGPTLLRDVPYSMSFWLVFDFMKSRYLTAKLSEVTTLSGDSVGQDLPFCPAFLFGATSGLLAGIITHPFDVIKTHRQVALGETISCGTQYSKSTWICLLRLYKANGVQAIFTGFTPRLLKTTNASAIMIATFETLKHYFATRLDPI
ncbi:unnamed protein product [Calicophoron daubneyi]|uniref:Mitochondrial carrier protein n=1 Tax=Calicophoron daubneyi TaxID=300641 RepID=A0AAV2T9E0_CALDB